MLKLFIFLSHANRNILLKKVTLILLSMNSHLLVQPTFMYVLQASASGFSSVNNGSSGIRRNFEVWWESCTQFKWYLHTSINSCTGWRANVTCHWWRSNLNGCWCGRYLRKTRRDLEIHHLWQHLNSTSPVRFLGVPNREPSALLNLTQFFIYVHFKNGLFSWINAGKTFH